MFVHSTPCPWKQLRFPGWYSTEGGGARAEVFFRLGTEQVRSPVQSGVAGGHAKWFRALPAVAPPKRRSVTECRPMTPGAGPSAETECEANARAPQPPSAALLGYGMLTRIPILSDCYRSAILDLARDVDD